MNRLVVSTYTALGRQDLEAFFVEVAESGHTSVELLAAAPHVDLEDINEAADRILKVVRDTGVRVNSVVPSGVDVNLASTQAGMRHWSVQQFISAVRLAAQLGAPQSLVHPGRRHPLRPPPMTQLRGWVVDGLTEILDVARVEGVDVLLENVPTGLLDRAPECSEVARAMDGQLQLCYDVANGFIVEDVTDGLTASKPWLGLVHLSDTTRARWMHDPLGHGCVPFRHVLETLQGIGYTGRLVLETLHDRTAADGFAADRRVLSEAGWSDYLSDPGPAR